LETREASGIPRDAAFTKPKKRCRACLTALLVTALQTILAFTCFVIFVDFVVPTPEVKAAYWASLSAPVNESKKLMF
jgi:hypothetical protein